VSIKTDLEAVIEVEKEKPRQNADMRLSFTLPLNPTTDDIQQLGKNIVEAVNRKARGKAYNVVIRARENDLGTRNNVVALVNWL